MAQPDVHSLQSLGRHERWSRLLSASIAGKFTVIIDVSDVAFGHTTKMRWNDGDQWIYSEKVVHPALVSDDTFAEVQQILAGRSGGQHEPHRSRHDYALRGLLVCGLCDRRMQCHWANAAPYYRCTFATELPVQLRH